MTLFNHTSSHYSFEKDVTNYRNVHNTLVLTSVPYYKMAEHFF